MPKFQSLTRDSNHSNNGAVTPALKSDSFNPSRGIAIIQTQIFRRTVADVARFNPSRGIAIIQTVSSVPRSQQARAFQSLTRDSNHSNQQEYAASSGSARFNPSRGIAIIQTYVLVK